MDLTIRPLRLPEEREFLDDVIYLACTWYEPTPERPHPDRGDLLGDKMLVYHENWGRPGDACLVAEVDGKLVGGAFYRTFTQDRPSQAFVDERTPELGIACVDGFRGTGLGRALIVALLTQARLDGFEQISLAVSNGNYSRHLYDAVGFVEHEPHGDKGWTMLRPLVSSR